MGADRLAADANELMRDLLVRSLRVRAARMCVSYDWFRCAGLATKVVELMPGDSRLFGPIASTATPWRILDKIDASVLNRMRAARHRHGNNCGPNAARPSGRPAGIARVGGPGLVCGSCSTPPW